MITEGADTVGRSGHILDWLF